jgi:hypothetical protein
MAHPPLEVQAEGLRLSVPSAIQATVGHRAPPRAVGAIGVETHSPNAVLEKTLEQIVSIPTLRQDQEIPGQA